MLAQIYQRIKNHNSDYLGQILITDIEYFIRSGKERKSENNLNIYITIYGLHNGKLVKITRQETNNYLKNLYKFPGVNKIIEGKELTKEEWVPFLEKNINKPIFILNGAKCELVFEGAKFRKLTQIAQKLTHQKLKENVNKNLR